jgi:hypothetical protein
MEKSNKCDINVVLNELSGENFASIYTTLISIVQGLAVAELLGEFDKLYFIYDGKGGVIFNLTYLPFTSPLATSIFIKILSCFLLICLTWHRYIVSNQLHRWWIKPVDAVIPFSFAVFQTALILCIPLDDWYFTLVVCVLAVIGWWAYTNVLTRHSESGVKIIFIREFPHEGHSHGERLFDEIGDYTKKGRRHMAALAVILMLMTFLLLLSKEIIPSWIPLSVLLFILVWQLFFADFYEHIKKSCDANPL